MVLATSLQTVVYNSQNDIAISSEAVQNLVEQLLDYLEIATDQVIVYFVTTSKITEMHKEFFQDPTPTDCITFPLDPPKQPGESAQNDTDASILGEVFVCPQTAIEYAEKNSLDPYDEISLYIIHGCLHLIGYQDVPESARDIMKKKENACFAYLQEKKCLLSS